MDGAAGALKIIGLLLLAPLDGFALARDCLVNGSQALAARPDSSGFAGRVLRETLLGRCEEPLA